MSGKLLTTKLLAKVVSEESLLGNISQESLTVAHLWSLR
jgi:hypothetical protein